jgi:ElaB/YqjD/DUF883 family membrane-anchored ribosome-binding protein
MAAFLENSELQAISDAPFRTLLWRQVLPASARRVRWGVTMPNDITNAFPETRRDVNNLKETAKDAAKDLASTATTHVNKVRGQVQDLASHAQSEAYDQFGQVRGRAEDLADTARDFVLARPLTCLGVALAIGFVFGVSRRGSRD